MRDRDVRNAVQSALQATGQFDLVSLTGLPEDYGFGASNLKVCVIEPVSTQEDPRWDAQTFGGMVNTSQVSLTFIARFEDAQLRDEQVEQLVDVAANAINGNQLGTLVIPGLTRITSWQWQPPSAPERRIKATFQYAYLVPGWQALDTSN
jgi:hypothetical protein